VNVETIILGLAILAPFLGCVWAARPARQRDEFADRTKRRLVSDRRVRDRLGLEP
jgi:hypothetical protein